MESEIRARIKGVEEIGSEKVRRKPLPIGRVEKEKGRGEGRGHVELTKKEIYETIGVCPDTNENNDLCKIGYKKGEISPEIQWKVVNRMKSKSKEHFTRD